MSDQSNLSNFGTGDPPQTDQYECEICGRSFDSSKGRGIHRGQSHTDREMKQAMIKEIDRLHDMLGKTPSLRDMDQQGNFGSKTYQKKFGTWNNALRAADLSVNKQQKITESDLVKELKRIAEKLERTPTSRDMAELGEYASSSYTNTFGSWNDAIQEANLEITRHRHISKSELIEELKRLADELERTPTSRDMIEHGNHSPTSYTRAFETWNDAIQEANLETTRHRQVPKSELIEELKRLADKLGQTPTNDQMMNEGRFAVGAFVTAFGSWNAAIEAADLEKHIQLNVSRSDLLDEIKRLADELGRTPRVTDMDADGEFAHATYERLFGSWAESLNQANLEHQRVRHPDKLDHMVRSTWEEQVAHILIDAGVTYEYESEVIRYNEGAKYIPDFVTDNYVIEVKGNIYRDEREHAKAAMRHLDNREYVVVGAKLPADIHIQWDEREKLRQLL
jgi:hypothetical protein